MRFWKRLALLSRMPAFADRDKGAARMEPMQPDRGSNTPHPVPLLLGEGTVWQSARRKDSPLSWGEGGAKRRVRDYDARDIRHKFAARKSFRLGKRLAWAALALVVALSPAVAVTPDEMLQDSKQEARARALSQHLRCVVCQNQSIDDSNAPLAHDLRVLLRERIAGGDTDGQAVDYIVARYGNFVLLQPPFQLNTLLLWLGPAIVLVLAALGFGKFLRDRGQPGGAAPEPEPFTGDEKRRLDELLNKGSAE